MKVVYQETKTIDGESMQYYGMASGSRVAETHGMSQLLQVKACLCDLSGVGLRGCALGRPLQVRDQVECMRSAMPLLN